MAQAEFEDTLSVDQKKLFDAVTQYENYPKFLDGCTGVEVDRKGPHQARVTYQVSMMKEITYTLDHTSDPEKGIMKWSLVDSDALKKNSGQWQIEAAGDGKSNVKYTVDVEFKIPVPGFILSKLVKGSLPQMIKSFEKQAKKSK